MLDHAETLFENMQVMMKKLKKASYEKNMEDFRRQHGSYLAEMVDYVNNSEDKRQAAAELAEDFTNQLKTAFSVKGKIKSRTQIDMNFFMIYYVFPAILMTESEYAGMLADYIRDAWRVKFKDSSNIEYADYDKIYGAFQNKIFGIF